MNNLIRGGGLAVAWLGTGIDATWAEALRRQAVVLTTVENMYSAPDASKDVVSQALLGQVVGVLEIRQGFARVQTPDGYAGWLPANALFNYPAPVTQGYAARGEVAEVTSLMANLYREASVTSARPRMQAPFGARLELAASEPRDGWLLVRLPAGETAFVQKGDVRLVQAGAPRARGSEADLVSTARKFLGAPYLWGGMTAHGVDCSGFMSRVFHANGIDLLRDAHMQFDDPKATHVEPEARQPGDLVFFGKTKISHVGMYVGEGRFIHATTHERPVVQESVLSDPYWSSIYRGARRPN